MASGSPAVARNGPPCPSALAARRRSGRSGCPARRSRCSTAAPVARSHTTVVSRWLVMPRAARSAPQARLRPARRADTASRRPRSRSGRAPPSPACGRSAGARAGRGRPRCRRGRRSCTGDGGALVDRRHELRHRRPLLEVLPIRLVRRALVVSRHLKPRTTPGPQPQPRPRDATTSPIDGSRTRAERAVPLGARSRGKAARSGPVSGRRTRGMGMLAAPKSRPDHRA